MDKDLFQKDSKILSKLSCLGNAKVDLPSEFLIMESRGIPKLIKVAPRIKELVSYKDLFRLILIMSQS